MRSLKNLTSSVITAIESFLNSNPGKSFNPQWLQSAPPLPLPRPGKTGTAATKRAARKKRNRLKARCHA